MISARRRRGRGSETARRAEATAFARLLEIHDYEGPVPRDFGTLLEDAGLTNGQDKPDREGVAT